MVGSSKNCEDSYINGQNEEDTGCCDSDQQPNTRLIVALLQLIRLKSIFLIEQAGIWKTVSNFLINLATQMIWQDYRVHVFGSIL